MATVWDSKSMNIKNSEEEVLYLEAKMTSIDSIDKEDSKVRDL